MADRKGCDLIKIHSTFLFIKLSKKAFQGLVIHCDNGTVLAFLLSKQNPFSSKCFIWTTDSPQDSASALVVLRIKACKKYIKNGGNTALTLLTLLPLLTLLILFTLLTWFTLWTRFTLLTWFTLLTLFLLFKLLKPA